MSASLTNQEVVMPPPAGGNPIARFTRWLGWSEDQYLSAAGYIPLLAAFGAGVVLSYTSLTDLADWLGFGRFERPFFPFAIDALVFGCYIAQTRVAGVKGFGAHRLYLVGLGLVAGLLTASGNALHGLIVWKIVTLPLPWPILVAGSLVPALAMVGVGHALAICRAAARQRAVQGAGQMHVSLPVMDALHAVQPATRSAINEPVTSAGSLTDGRTSDVGHGSSDGRVNGSVKKPVSVGRTTPTKNRQLRRAALLLGQQPEMTGAELGKRLKVSAATGQRYLRELAEQAAPLPLSVVSARERA